MLTRKNFIGPWAGLPVAWTDDDRFDEEIFRGDVARCCHADIPGVYTGGTTGEFYAMEFDEFQAVARAAVEECHAHGKPAMIGCSSTYTLGAVRRAAYAAELGADAVQVALPFWMEVDDRDVVPFFKAVSDAAGGLPLSIYDTVRAKKTPGVEQHRAIKEAVPNYLMVKSNAGTIGFTPEGCKALGEFVNVFIHEHKAAGLGQMGAVGCCSASVYWNPRVVLELWRHVHQRDWQQAEAVCKRLADLIEFLAAEYGTRGFTDTAYDRMGGRAGGFLKTSLRSRGPYISATQEDVEKLRAWYGEHFPEMLEVQEP
ncbi:MAG: dihydrodipicolinate synthase family protein [Planctomycetota bacterium]|nr:dihydrodipicolinate synthase family protein [Planctomycetota bacterium]